MAVTLRTSANAGGTTGTTDRTASIVAVAGDLLVVSVAISGATVVNAITDDAGGTYTIIGHTRSSTVTTTGLIAVRNSLIASGATVTVTVDTTTNDSAHIGILAWTGMTRLGSAAVRSFGFTNGTAGTPACVLNKTPLGLAGSGGPMIAVLASDDTTTTPPAVMTEQIDASQITPTIALEVATRITYAGGDADAGQPNATVTWGAAASGDWVAMAIELDASPVKMYVKIGEQRMLNGGPSIYTPTSGTKAIKAHIIGSGGGGGAGQTTTGAAGGGGGSGEWAVIWYAPGSLITGGAATVPAGGATGAAGSTASLVVDGITFSAVGGGAGSNSTAVASYGEATAPALGTAGSLNYDIDRGISPSVAAMATSTTTISAYTAGIGGGTPYGRGGRGSGGDAVGEAGTGFGAGGGGGRRGAATNRDGGAGAPAGIIIEEYAEMPTAAEIASAVWEEARAGHVTAGSFGEGVVVNSIAANAVSATAIASNAITAAKIAANAITSSQIATDAIGAAQIAANAITAAKIAANAITSSQIATDAIGAAQIAANAITSAKIATDAIGSAQLATDCITSAQIAATAVTEIQSGLASSAVVANIQSVVDENNTLLLALPTAAEIDTQLSGTHGAGVWDAVPDQNTFVHSQPTLGQVLTSMVYIVDADNAPVDADATPVLTILRDDGVSINLTGLTSWSHPGTGEYQVSLTLSGSVFAVGRSYTASVACAVSAVAIEGIPLGFPAFEIIEAPATAAALTIVDDFLDTEIAAIKAKTDNLPTDPADASDITAAFGTVNSTLSTIAGYLDTEIAAIKAKTDSLNFTVAGQVDANMTYISGDSTAADNLELQFDGTGLTGATFPMRQDGTVSAASIVANLMAFVVDDTGAVDATVKGAFTSLYNFIAGRMVVAAGAGTLYAQDGTTPIITGVGLTITDSENGERVSGASIAGAEGLV